MRTDLNKTLTNKSILTELFKINLNYFDCDFKIQLPTYPDQNILATILETWQFDKPRALS